MKANCRARSCYRSSFDDQLILIVFLVVGFIRTLLAFDPRKVGQYFLQRKQASNARNKSGQLPREFRVAGSSFSEVQQFLGNEVIKCRLQTIT